MLRKLAKRKRPMFVLLRRFLSSSLLITLPAGFASAAPVEVLRDFAPHTATYKMVLDDRSDRAGGIQGAYGRLVYQIEGDYCEGFVTKFRFVLNFDTGANEVLSDYRMTAYEAPNGTDFSFVSKTYTNEVLETEGKGSAKLGADELNIELKKPETAEYTRKTAQFPTLHLGSILQSAKEGKTFYRANVFDGAHEGNEVFFTQTVIGKEKKVADEDGLPTLLKGKSWWPVSVSYFREGEADELSGEGQPFYIAAFKLYENGISSDLELDYQDFSLKGVMEDLKQQAHVAPAKCN